MECVNCDQSIEEGFNFCPNCGRQITNSVIDPQEHCIRCAYNLNVNINYCSQCGAHIAKQVKLQSGFDKTLATEESGKSSLNLSYLSSVTHSSLNEADSYHSQAEIVEVDIQRCNDCNSGATSTEVNNGSSNKPSKSSKSSAFFEDNKGTAKRVALIAGVALVLFGGIFFAINSAVNDHSVSVVNSTTPDSTRLSETSSSLSYNTNSSSALSEVTNSRSVEKPVTDSVSNEQTTLPVATKVNRSSASSVTSKFNEDISAATPVASSQLSGDSVQTSGNHEPRSSQVHVNFSRSLLVSVANGDWLTFQSDIKGRVGGPIAPVGDRNSARRLNDEAMGLLKLDSKMAVSLLSKAHSIDPSDEGIAANLGLAYMVDGNFKSSQDHFFNIIEIWPDRAIVWFNFAQALSLQGGRSKEAVGALVGSYILSKNQVKTKNYYVQLRDNQEEHELLRADLRSALDLIEALKLE